MHAMAYADVLKFDQAIHEDPEKVFNRTSHKIMRLACALYFMKIGLSNGDSIRHTQNRLSKTWR